ncbi:MAG TPA: diacylglycerol kinase family protein [Longimicrobiales bacterium]|nr:diacylglycerol kinase family protein [Longimicrobiales bacterium]
MIIRPRGADARIEELRQAVQRLRAQGHRVRPRLTFEGGDARRFAENAARAHCDMVLAAGGDGTINEVVNGIVRSRWQPRLGIVPVGTANDFASGLGLPAGVSDAVGVAVRGRPLAVDVARVNRRFFINVSTGGFGAEATAGSAPEQKRRLGAFAYILAGAKQLVGMTPTAARFIVNGEVLHDGGFLVFAVGNARQTGGGTLITPRARYGDGKLDLVVVPALSRLDFLSLLPDLRTGSHLESPDVLYVQASEIMVEARSPITVNADGEPMAGRRFRYGIRRRPLTVMAGTT